MKTININEAMDNYNNYVFIDLRSPKEFEEDTIKGAINIPILDNDARHMVGALYKLDKEKAYMEGFKIGSLLMPSIYEQVLKIKQDNPEKEIILFCFRGGTRSSSVHSMLDILKLKTIKLEGGYKVYRNFVIDEISRYAKGCQLLVLTGNTGSGKTLLLNSLEKNGYPVLDLERMANNRGSVFGRIGLGDKVTQKQFETELFFAFKKQIDLGKNTFFIESESIKIGNINVPQVLFDKMNEAEHILVKPSLAKRVEIIANDYQLDTVDNDKILGIIERNEYFKKVLGKKWVDGVIDNLNNKEYSLFIEKMLVDYYDKLYGKSHRTYSYIKEIENDDFNEIEKEIVSLYLDFVAK